MMIADPMFDDFFSKPLPQEGFEIDPTEAQHPGLIPDGVFDKRELHGYEVTMEGEVIVPELRPTGEVRKG